MNHFYTLINLHRVTSIIKYFSPLPAVRFDSAKHQLRIGQRDFPRIATSSLQPTASELVQLVPMVARGPGRGSALGEDVVL
jgi:hypothetical protein